jgi:hypothetical protein
MVAASRLHPFRSCCSQYSEGRCGAGSGIPSSNQSETAHAEIGQRNHFAKLQFSRLASGPAAVQPPLQSGAGGSSRFTLPTGIPSYQAISTPLSGTAGSADTPVYRAGAADMNRTLIIAILVGFAMVHGLAIYIKNSTLRSAEPEAASLDFRGD